MVKLPGVGLVMAPEPEHRVLLLRRTRRRITLQVGPSVAGVAASLSRIVIVHETPCLRVYHRPESFMDARCIASHTHMSPATVVFGALSAQQQQEVLRAQQEQ